MELSPAIVFPFRRGYRGAARWSARGGYRELLLLAVPLILSNGSQSLMQFCDRVILSWSSPEALAAATPAGAFVMSFSAVFSGVVCYVGTFIAHAFGAGGGRTVGRYLWQGVWLSLAAEAVLLVPAFFAPELFALFGHDAALREMEADYFRILCGTQFVPLMMQNCAGFHSGRGRTGIVAAVTLAGVVVNVVLDYVLVLGTPFTPALGISGAAIATVFSAAFSLAIYLVTIFTAANEREYGVLSEWRPHFPSVSRLVRFGAPSGLQFMVDMGSFSWLLMVIGTIGTVELAASNIAFQIEMLALLPLIGIGVATSIAVGQHQGARRPDRSSRAVRSGVHVMLVYVVLFVAAVLAAPELFLWPFRAGADAGEFREIFDLAGHLMYFVAAYVVSDGFFQVYGNAIKGAGETKFVMVVIFVGAALFMVTFPMLLLKAGFGFFAIWFDLIVYAFGCCAAFVLRYRSGRWKKIDLLGRDARE